MSPDPVRQKLADAVIETARKQLLDDSVPAFEDRGPHIVIVFAEDDRALKEKLTGEGRLTPSTVVADRRES